MTPGRIRAARLIAAAVDLFQIALLPTFLPAALSGIDNVVDIAAAVVLVTLVRWHWAFLPSFLVELVPVAEIAPTWTLAVYIATRGAASEGSAQPPPSLPGA